MDEMLMRLALCVVKTEKLAENHYKRVSNFAKEMLVWPEEIDVHKIKNPQFVSDMKPARASPVPPIPISASPGPSRNSYELLERSKGAASSRVHS